MEKPMARKLFELCWESGQPFRIVVVIGLLPKESGFPDHVLGKYAQQNAFPLDFDGCPDAVTANGGTDGSSDASVLLGNCDGTFQAEQRFGAGRGPQALVLVDANRDGAPDIITANGSNVSVILHRFPL